MSTEQEITKEEREQLEKLLAEGEKLIWAGRPLPYHFNHEVWMFFLNGVIWTILDVTFIVLFVLGVIGQGEDVFTRLVSCSYLLLLLPLTLGACYSPIWNYRKMKHTVYAITDKQAITMGPDLIHGKYTPKKYPLRKDMIYEHRVRHNGTGDIIFKADEELQRLGFGKKKRPRAGFVRVKDIRGTKHILTEQIEAAEAAKAAAKK